MESKRNGRAYIVAGAAIVLAVYVIVFIVHLIKPLPSGVSRAWPVRNVSADSVHFLSDETYVDGSGVRRTEQEIFNEVISMIEEADAYVLVDMFLYNSFQGEPPETTRDLADDLTDALVLKKTSDDDVEVVVISDPINTVYGGASSDHFQRLRDAGVRVVLTDLTRLRDSNPLYSAFWRMVVQWFGVSNGGIAPHPFVSNGPEVPVRSWLALLNFKANHRKVVVADYLDDDGQRSYASLITSANPHDGSSAHGNVAIKIDRALWRDVYASEAAVVNFSSDSSLSLPEEVVREHGDVQVQLLTEGAILKRVQHMIDRARAGDSIDMAMFYLSERSIIESLIDAVHRDVSVRLLLDPNKDAFGHVKNGVPNRPVAAELLDKTDGRIAIRWCDTHGEQCHSKLVLVRQGDTYSMIAGSANLTRRNVGDYNLETNVYVRSEEIIPALQDAQSYFDRRWTNERGRQYSVAYESYGEESLFKAIMYRVQEATGLSSF